MFEEKQIRTASKSEVYELRSSILWNEGGKLNLSSLPATAQLAPFYAIDIWDIDDDGKMDILLGGNFYRSKPEVGIYDASFGLVLKGLGNQKFEALSAQQSGMKITGEIRDFLRLRSGKQDLLLVAKNNDFLKVFITNRDNS